MNHTSTNTVLAEYIEGVLRKPKFQTFYSIAMDQIILNIWRPLKQYRKSYKQVFGGQQCFAMPMPTSHSAINANERKNQQKTRNET